MIMEAAAVFGDLAASGAKRVAHREASIVVDLVAARLMAHDQLITGDRHTNLDAEAIAALVMMVGLVDDDVTALDPRLQVLEIRGSLAGVRLERRAGGHVAEGHLHGHRHDRRSCRRRANSGARLVAVVAQDAGAQEGPFFRGHARLDLLAQVGHGRRDLLSRAR